MSAFWIASPPLRVLLLSALSCLWPIRALLHCARALRARCCSTPRRYRRRPRRKAPEGGNLGRRSGPSAKRKQAQVLQRPLVLSAVICFLFSLCVFKSQVLLLFWCWPRGHQRGNRNSHRQHRQAKCQSNDLFKAQISFRCGHNEIH